MAVNKKELSISNFKKLQPSKSDFTEIYEGKMLGDTPKSVYKPFDSNSDKLFAQISAECQRIMNIEGNDWRKDVIKNLKFGEETYSKLDSKMLNNLANFLSKMNKIHDDYNKKIVGLPAEAGLKIEYDKAKEIMKTAAESVGRNIANLNNLKDYGIDQYRQLVNDVDIGFYHENDLAVVRAFEYCGSSIIQEKQSDGSFKWKCAEGADYNNGNGALYYDKDGNEQHFVLDRDQVEKFLKDYLNQPYEDRPTLITPDGIFKFYQKSIDDKVKGLNSYEKGIVKQTKQDNLTKYSMDNSEWSDYILEDENFAKLNASRLVSLDLVGKLIKPEEIAELEDTGNKIVKLNKFKHLFDMSTLIEEGVNNETNEYDAAHKSILDKYTTRIKSIQADMKKIDNKESQEYKTLKAKLEKVSSARIYMLQYRSLQLRCIAKIEKEWDKSKESKQDFVDKCKDLIKQFEFLNIKFEKAKDGDYYQFVYDENEITDTKIKEALKEYNEDIVKAYKNKPEKNQEATEKSEEEQTNEADGQGLGTPTNGQSPIGQTPPTSGDNGFTVSSVDLMKDIMSISYSNGVSVFHNIQFKAENNLFRTLQEKGIVSRYIDTYTSAAAAQVYRLDIMRASEIFNALRDPNSTYALAKKNGENEQNIKRILVAEYEKAKKTYPNLDNVTAEEFDKREKGFMGLYQGLYNAGQIAEVLDDKTHNTQQEAELAGKTIEALQSKNKELFKDALDAGTISKDEFDELTKENEQTQTPEEAADLSEVVKRKFKDKYPVYSNEALMKKLKPFCAKTGAKFLDNILKSIDNTEIYEKKNPQSNSGPTFGGSDGQGTGDQGEIIDKYPSVNPNGQGQNSGTQTTGQPANTGNGANNNNPNSNNGNPAAGNTNGQNQTGTQPANPAAGNNASPTTPQQPVGSKENISKEEVQDIESKAYALMSEKLKKILSDNSKLPEEQQKFYTKALRDYQVLFDFLGTEDSFYSVERQQQKKLVLDILSNKAFRTDRDFENIKNTAEIDQLKNGLLPFVKNALENVLSYKSDSLDKVIISVFDVDLKEPFIGNALTDDMLKKIDEARENGTMEQLLDDPDFERFGQSLEGMCDEFSLVYCKENNLQTPDGATPEQIEYFEEFLKKLKEKQSTGPVFDKARYEEEYENGDMGMNE